MNTDAEKTAIQSLVNAARQAFHDKDSATINAQFVPNAVIFDLAPPLVHGPDVAALTSWLASWDGPVDQEWRDLTIAVGGDLAFCHGLCKVSAKTKADGQQAEWWQRATVCLSRGDGGWKIVHEHTSVPFHMDGSFRAATDLQP